MPLDGTELTTPNTPAGGGQEPANNPAHSAEPTPTGGGQEPANTPTPSGQQGDITLTSEQLAERLKRNSEKAIKDHEDAQAEAKRVADLDATTRATEAEAKAAQAQKDADARVLTAQREAKLHGVVSNPEMVLKLIDNAEDFFDGAIPKAEAILAAFPMFAPTPTGPAPTGGAGGQVPTAGSKEQQMAAALAAGDMVTYIALQEAK